MRRSLQLRLLALSLSIASFAMIATTLLAAHSTMGAPPQAAVEGPARPEIDSEIRAALLGYADERRSWTGVEPLVRDLAHRTGRRIALTTPDGSPIVDSALLGGTDAGVLPPPAARIDATSPRHSPVPAQPVGGGQMRTVTTHPDPIGWQLTDHEKAERQALADAATECLRGAGVEARIWIGATWQVLSSAPLVAGAAVPTHPCVPTELLAPSAAATELAIRSVELTVACLDRHAVPHTVALSTRGLPEVRPAGRTSPSSQWTACTQASRAEAKRPFVAPPADLHLGTSHRFDPFAPDVAWRTGATVAAVALAAALITVIAGRRLVRPLRALTAAAARVATGDYAARVSTAGDAEVSRLASTFNVMIESVARGQRQRTVMVGELAHELRNPLANVRGQLEAAEDGVLPLDSTLLRSVQQECDLLTRLVSDLQDLAMAEAGALRLYPEERDAADLAAQAVAAHRGRTEKAGVHLRLHAPDPVPVLADPARLRQALGNLVANAVAHSPADTPVEVTVHQSAGSVLLAVTDHGPGIAAEHLPRLFERFYRVNLARGTAAGGTGLGLAITKHIAEAHGGGVEVASTPGDRLDIHDPDTDSALPVGPG